MGEIMEWIILVGSRDNRNVFPELHNNFLGNLDLLVILESTGGNCVELVHIHCLLDFIQANNSFRWLIGNVFT